MRIIGDGLIARSLQPFAGAHDRVLAFATGVSDSACTSDTEFARECALLYEVLEDARSAHAKIVYFSGGGALYGRWDRPAIESGPLEPRS
jgi:nucleoside-diphosphate-sugar epimerase